MASSRRFALRDSPFAFGAHLLLTLLTVCLLFEILHLLTFTSATPIDHLTQRRDDFGPNDASIYHGLVDTSVGSSETSKRDFGENVKAAFEDLGDTVKGIFNLKGDKKTPAEYVSEYAYNELDHQIPLEKLKESFEKTYKSMKHSDHQVSDEDWVHDQVKNVIPELKKRYDEANKSDSASRHHEREANDKPRPKSGTPEYYTDPSFFPYPMPPTPNITEELKVSLGDAFNQWWANTTEVANSSCSAACSKADAITTKVDHTSEKKRKEMVEACIQSIIDYPSCLANYQSADVLKPYLTELVDKGTIKDEDGMIKKFYKRMPVSAGSPVTPELDLSQNFKDILADAFKKYKDDIAIHSDMSCPMTKENTCENPSLVSGAGYDMSPREREHVLETCIVFISWHPNCLDRYETTNFIEPHLEALAASGKIDGYVSNGSEKRDNLAHSPEPEPDDSPEPEPDDSKGGLALLDQYFKELLGHVFNDYKKDIADHSDMSCHLSKENTCENSTLLSAAEADAMDFEEHRWMLESCVIFLSWHPICLQKYETTYFIKPYLEDLADRGKIEGYTPESTRSGNSTGDAGAALRRGLVHAVGAKPTATAKHVVSSEPLPPPDPSLGHLIGDSVGALFGYFHEPKPSTTTESVGPNPTVVQRVPVYMP